MDKQKPEWLSRVKQTHSFHVSKLRDNPKWRVKDTAKALNRAIGPISEELKIASWLRTHEAQLCEFEYIHEAIEYIRERKHHMLTQDLDIE